ncbi:hypothetical protein D3093_08760 [Azospirillum argentinense]|jgi:hypothetical protein|uniref:Uncharacterized protein n=1 Tax=Azospirillum argentinense TaxID=2970906 RepID=A0A4D8PG68_9PROT|nr:hypothetical protein [Azospirillum argentinense]QCN95337.1 hypothetical protein D3093_08760 [Azospirillum argentinense]
MRAVSIMVIPVLAGVVGITAPAIGQDKYHRPEVLNAMLSGDTGSVKPRNETENTAMMGYTIGFLGKLDKRCSVLNDAEKFTLGVAEVLGAVGGMPLILSAANGESDANKLANDYGCWSREVQKIVKAMLSADLIK